MILSRDDTHLLNDFFKLLKKLSQNELYGDDHLVQLLSEVDEEKGIIDKEGKLKKNEITSLGEELCLHFSAPKAEKVLSISTKLLENDLCEALKKIYAIPDAQIEQNDITVSNLLKKAEAWENRKVDAWKSFSEQTDTLISNLKVCLNDPAWKNKAKNTFGPPQGIRQLIKIFGNSDLYAFDKLLRARKILEKKFKRLDHRDKITSDFYDNLSRQLDSWYEKFGSEYEKNRQVWSAKFMPLRWYEAKYSELTAIVLEIEKSVKNISGRLQHPNFTAELAEGENYREDKVTSITYNTQQLIGTPHQGTRAKKLIDFFHDKEVNADVIVLEEAFQSNFREKLEKSFLARDYYIIKPKGCELINSGVCILLKKETFGAFPFLQITQEDYPTTTATSWDKIVPKGFTHVTVSNEEKKTHIIGTHTQAQYKPMQIIATLAQLARLGQYISRLPENEPLQVLGDLNIPRQRGEFKILKYLLLLDDQPTPTGQYSYDSVVNPLVKDNNQFTLDYIFTRGYERKDTEIVINERTKEISDHFPLYTELKYLHVTGRDELSVEQQQDRILSQLIQSAYHQIAKKGWETTAGKKIHFVVFALIEAIERNRAEGIELGSGDEFLDYCLEYKLPTADKLDNLYFQPPSESVLHFALKEVMAYKVNSNSPEVTRFNLAVNNYLEHVKQYLEKELAKLDEKNTRTFQAEFMEIFNNEKLMPWEKIACLYKISKKAPQVAKFIMPLHAFYAALKQSDSRGQKNQNVFDSVQEGIVPNISITITKKEAELAEILRANLATVLDRKVEELEIFLIEFKQQVYRLYAKNTFPATGIKHLKKLLHRTGEFYDFEGNAQEKNIVYFLDDALKIIDKRLNYSSDRTKETQFFYLNARKYLHALLQSERLTRYSSHSTETEQVQRTKEIFSDIQKNVKEFSKESVIEDSFFLKLSDNFQDLKKRVNLDDWNTKGQGFFRKKTPDGIIVLRKLLREVSDDSQELVTPAEKVKLIKLFMEIHRLTGRKALAKKRFRDDAIQDFYETVHKSLGSAYGKLEGYQKDTFDFLYLNRDKPAEVNLCHLSRFSTNIFDITPGLLEEFDWSKRVVGEAQEPNGLLLNP